MEEDDDVPLASRMKIKFEADVKVEKSKKRKAEEMDEEDDYEDEDDYVAVKKENKKIKEEKQQKSSKKASQNGTPSPTKRVKKEKKEEEETWKWYGIGNPIRVSRVRCIGLRLEAFQKRPFLNMHRYTADLSIHHGALVFAAGFETVFKQTGVAIPYSILLSRSLSATQCFPRCF